jgi:hypothetical protein
MLRQVSGLETVRRLAPASPSHPDSDRHGPGAQATCRRALVRAVFGPRPGVHLRAGLGRWGRDDPWRAQRTAHMAQAAHTRWTIRGCFSVSIVKARMLSRCLDCFHGRFEDASSHEMDDSRMLSRCLDSLSAGAYWRRRAAKPQRLGATAPKRSSPAPPPQPSADPSLQVGPATRIRGIQVDAWPGP